MATLPQKPGLSPVLIFSPVPDPIPDDVRRFVLTSVPSVPHLEALLLLRAEPRDWTTADLAARLYIAERNAERLLEDLCGAGLAACTDTLYRYQPASDATRGLLDSVARAYAQHLVAMTNLIHSSTERKAQQFAAAFTFRKRT